MSRIFDILKKATEEKMDFHKRQATGQAVESLREVQTLDSIKVYGIDYWKEINEGVKAGTLVSLESLSNWQQGKQSRYGVRLPPLKAIQRKLYTRGSSTPQDKLQITKQVIESTKNEIGLEVRKLVNKNLKLA